MTAGYPLASCISAMEVSDFVKIHDGQVVVLVDGWRL